MTKVVGTPPSASRQRPSVEATDAGREHMPTEAQLDRLRKRDWPRTRNSATNREQHSAFFCTRGGY